MSVSSMLSKLSSFVNIMLGFLNDIHLVVTSVFNLFLNSSDALFVNKNIVPSGEHIVKSDIDLLGTIEFELDSKFVDNFEIILNNNILKVPMQNAAPDSETILP